MIECADRVGITCPASHSHCPIWACQISVLGDASEKFPARNTTSTYVTILPPNSNNSSMPGIVGTLRINILDARIEKDNSLGEMLDTPDCYVRAEIQNKAGQTVKNRTKTKDNTYTPVFNEAIFVKNVSTSETLYMSVWDSDTFSSDDEIARTEVELSKVFGSRGGGNKTISCDLRDKGSRGMLRVELTFVPQGSLDVLVQRAEGLQADGETPDPYCIVWFHGKKHKTDRKNNESSPVWNEKICLGSVDLQDIKKGQFVFDELTFSVMDHDKFSSDDKLAEAKITLEPLMSSCSVNLNLPLSRGKLYAQLQFTPETTK
ncbi:C2 domain [Carpediemonas membranifera]|uniref:C2 domain n=1 Tax=Carpediemonas membranifera TaxID=201153 RepID=A0A8J6B6K7_9EUKA|nr:C2 domain [Carpediemonas membranifera]|eukprot:KAG9396738.1 C2 domain [Carpediemonas membranifera]